MKRIVLFFAVAFCLASCLKSNFSSSYNVTVTFEYNNNSVYQNEFSKDSICVLKEGIAFTWLEPSLAFGQKSTNGQFNGGFIMSYLAGETDGALTKVESLNDRYRVFAATGYNKSKTYTVFYDNHDPAMMPVEDISFTYKSLGTCVMNECYVNNTTFVARKIKEHFQEGDALVLTAKGYLKDEPTASAAIKLAEFTAAKDSIMYNWTRFDLAPLGSVDKVEFIVESTNPNVPGYVCVDDMKANFTLDY